MTGAALPLSSRLPAQLVGAVILWPALAMILVFMVAPVAIMAVYSFLEPATYGGVVWSFSTAGYEQILFERDFLTDALVFSPDYVLILWRSVAQAAVATVLCLVISVPTAYFIATRPERTKAVWIYLITIPYWVNLLIRTIALLFILRDDGPINATLMATGLTSSPLPLSYNSFAIGLGLVYSFLPFMVLPLYAALDRMDPRLVEAAQDLYSSPWTAFRKVTWKLSLPGVVAGTLLTFIPAAGDYINAELLGTTKIRMIGNVIQDQFFVITDYPTASALSVMLMLVILVMVTIYVRRAGTEELV